MKAHDLARQLLAGPDLPVTLSIQCSKDAVTSTDEDGNPGPNETVDELDVKSDEQSSYNFV